MPKIITDVHRFKADRAWGAKTLAHIEGASVKLHWTDEPYKWHTNDGNEAFVVLSGSVDMHYRIDGKEFVAHLKESDIFVAHDGDEHVAHPLGEARILVIERIGSI